MDSRTSAELVFDQELGDIFSIRSGGNILNEDIIGSMEFATKVVGTKIVLVLGHTKSGAIVGACNHVELGSLTKVLEKIKPAIDSETATVENRTGRNETFVNNITENNVHLNIAKIKKESPIIAELLNIGAIPLSTFTLYLDRSYTLLLLEDMSSSKLEILCWCFLDINLLLIRYQFCCN